MGNITAYVGGYGIDADFLAREIVQLEAKPRSDDPEDVVENKVAVKEVIRVPEVPYQDTINQWADITHRTIGHVDWAPEISVDVQGRRYTKDIGTFEVDAAKFTAQFRGNVVDLGPLCFIFLISTSSDKKNFRNQVCPLATHRYVLPQSRRSSSPPIASSGSTAVSRASSWSNPTVSTATARPALSL